LRRGEKYHAANFGEPQRGLHIQSGENRFERDGARLKFLDQFGNQAMDVAQVGIRRNRQGFQRPEGAQPKHPATIPVAFDHSETRGTGSGRVDSQYAIRLRSHANRNAAAEFMAAGKSPARVLLLSGRKILDDRGSGLPGHDGHLFFINVEVSKDVLYVIVLFERFDELEHLLGRRTR
jgi:hypothetical protein